MEGVVKDIVEGIVKGVAVGLVAKIAGRLDPNKDIACAQCLQVRLIDMDVVMVAAEQLEVET